MTFRSALSLLACAALATAEEPAADPWSKALGSLYGNGKLLFLDSAAVTQVRGVIAPDKVDLKIDWLFEKDTQVDFQQPVSLKDGRIQSTCRIGTTTVTRTLFASPQDNAVFIHFLADKPGALSFRVSLDAPQVRIEDRRQLISTAESGISTRLWVLPFESEVTPEARSITVRGEGEAMIVLDFSREKGAEKSLSQTLTRLGNTYDPGHFPPDPSRIWQGVLGVPARQPPDLPAN